MSGKMENEMPGLLSSWKEIAAFCGRSIGTVKLWHYKDGMPVVHRGKSVTAFPEEIISWLKNNAKEKIKPPNTLKPSINNT